MSKKHLLAELLLGKADTKQLPIDGVFEITPICNMSCKMCYVRKTQKEVQQSGGLKSIDEWLSLAHQAKEKGLLFLLLTGGEIFTYPDFEKLYIELNKMGFVLSLNTNGTIINESQLDCLVKHPPRSVNITLYGCSERTYEKLCGYPQGYKKAIETILHLKESGINVNINASLTPLNIEDFDQILNFTKEHHLAFEASSYMFPLVRKENDGSFIRFDAKEAALYAWYIRESLNTPMELKELKESYIHELSFNSEKDTNQFLKLQCRAGHSSFWITWDGKLTPCGMMSSPYGLPFEEGFESAWIKVVQEVKKLRLSSKCANCTSRRVCQVCAAKAYAETGHFDGTPSYLCTITKEMNYLITGITPNL